VFKSVASVTDLTEKQIDDFVSALLKVFKGYKVLPLPHLLLLSTNSTSRRSPHLSLMTCRTERAKCWFLQHCQLFGAR
jgi:hypothetical protein